MKKFANILLIVLFSGFILAMTLTGLLTPDEQYSMSERRALAQMPKITSKNVLSGKFMSDFDDYLADQFPFRDNFRSLKAQWSRNVFRKKDNNSLYLYKGHLSKLDYPMNEVLYDKTVSKLSSVYDAYIAGTDCRVYSSLIPDKNIFLAGEGGYPAYNFDKLAAKFAQSLNFSDYINISGTVSLDSFYRTDQHWKQEKIVDTASLLAKGMGKEIETNYSEVLVNTPFYGTYYGQAALKMPPDEIRYLTNETLNGCTVTSYNTGKAKKASVYNLEKAEGRDPYELFLEGADALITIENPKGEGELVIFRDSFGSSITPLLATGYAKITLVDLRYIKSEIIGQFIEFNNQDVLFLYSCLILNSGAIK